MTIQEQVNYHVKKDPKELGGKAPTEVISGAGAKLIELSLENLIT